MCFFLYMCLLCALVISVTIVSATTVFAVAVATFLVLSIHCLITMSPSLSSPQPSQSPLPQLPSSLLLLPRRRSCPRLNHNRQCSGIPVPLLSLMTSSPSSSLLLSTLYTPLVLLMLSSMLTPLLVLFALLRGLLASPLTTSRLRHLRTSNRQQSAKSDSRKSDWPAVVAMAIVAAAVRTMKMAMTTATAIAAPLMFTTTPATTLTTWVSCCRNGEGSSGRRHRHRHQ